MIRLGDCFIGNYPVTQYFGQNFKLANGTWAYRVGHMGWDFGTPNGAQIVAPTEGEVIRAGNYNDGYGVCVQIWNQVERFAVKLGHLKEVKVKVGDRVWFGRLIGYSDNTGFSTGAHLHVEACEVDANGYRINRTNGYDGLVDLAGKWSRVQNLTAPIPAQAPPPPVVITPPPVIPPVPSDTTPFDDVITPPAEPPAHVDDNTVKPPEPTSSEVKKEDPTIPKGFDAFLNWIQRFIDALTKYALTK